MGWTARDIPDHNGRVAVVTGANSGLGLETSRELARHGSTVVMAVRDLEKGRAARRDVLDSVPEAALELRHVDLASLASVRDFCRGFLADHPTLDVLVNNAGLMAIPERRTADGFEMQLGVNHLGHFALTAQLFPALSRSAGARVVCVTSSARRAARRVEPEDPHLRGRYDPWRAYARSKLANVQFAVALDRRARAAGLPVAALCADPGFSATGLQQHSVRATGGGPSQRFFDVAVRLVGSSPARGALPQLRAATDPRAEGGELYALRWVIFGPPVRRSLNDRETDPRRLDELWSLSERETGIAFDVAAARGDVRRGDA